MMHSKSRVPKTIDTLVASGVDEFPGSDIIAEFCNAHRMTPREKQILAMICRGMMNQQIGQELKVSNATIRLHISNIHRKLQTRSKVDLVLGIWQWSSRTGRVPPVIRDREETQS